jgi:hypothetical protein
MKLALCTNVRDDEDIMGHQLVYYHNLGIRNFYIMLHLPDIELEEVIVKAQVQLSDSKFTIFRYEKVDHYHENLVRVLTNRARVDGFDWMIVSDSDELLILKKHKTLEEFIASTNSDTMLYVSLLFKWYEYQPTKDLKPKENPFIEFKYRNPEPRPETKCVGKLNDEMFFAAGGHYLCYAPHQLLIDPSIAYYVHFPTRNKKQFIDKMKNQQVTWTIRAGSFILDKQMEDPNFLSSFFDGQVRLAMDNKDKLIYEPIDPKMFEI